MSVESTQIALRLTEKKPVLEALKKNRRLTQKRYDGVVEEVFITMFDGKSIEFRKGSIIPFNKSVAEALRRDNWVIVGDPLTGPVNPVFEIVNTFELGGNTMKAKFACPLCGMDMKSKSNLAKHLVGRAHAENAEKTVAAEIKPERGAIDYDTPLDKQIAAERDEDQDTLDALIADEGNDRDADTA
jgi:hypothetical protein